LMPRALSALLAVLCLLATVLFAAPVWAQRADVSAALSSSEVELGEMVDFTLQASSESGDAPFEPQLGAHRGFSIVNSGSSPTHMVTIINGRKSEGRGLTTPGGLRADRVGTFSIGPASVAIGGTRRTAPAQRITVVAPGAGGSTRPRRK